MISNPYTYCGTFICGYIVSRLKFCLNFKRDLLIKIGTPEKFKSFLFSSFKNLSADITLLVPGIRLSIFLYSLDFYQTRKSLYFKISRATFSIAEAALTYDLRKSQH